MGISLCYEGVIVCEIRNLHTFFNIYFIFIFQEIYDDIDTKAGKKMIDWLIREN